MIKSITDVFIRCDLVDQDNVNKSAGVWRHYIITEEMDRFATKLGYYKCKYIQNHSYTVAYKGYRYACNPLIDIDNTFHPL